MTSTDDIGARIARRVQSLRTAQGLSLEALATRAGVSRSMISLIERNEASPTAVVLEKLATGLGVVLATLFAADDDGIATDATAATLSRQDGQTRWRDPHSGYVRRNVSPVHEATASGLARSPIQIVEVEFPPGARVTYETAARHAPAHQQVWLLDGAMQLTVGEITHELHAGDCLAFALDQPVSWFNPTAQVARYAVVIASLPPSTF